MSVKTISFQTRTEQVIYNMMIAALKDFKLMEDRLASAQYRARQVASFPPWLQEEQEGAAKQELKDAQAAYDNLGGV
jgi:hypothetical protein